MLLSLLNLKKVRQQNNFKPQKNKFMATKAKQRKKQANTVKLYGTKEWQAIAKKQLDEIVDD